MKKEYISILIVCVYVCFYYVSSCEYNGTKAIHIETELLKRVFADYWKGAYPTRTNITVVTLNFNFINLVGFDSSRQVFAINVWFNLTWRDPRLAWNSSEYNHISTLHVEQTKVWKPDLTHTNGASKMTSLGWDDLLVEIRSDGTVSWTPGDRLEIACQLDLVRFPFDYQKCHAIFSAWTQTVDLVRMKLDPVVGLVAYIPHEEWDLLSITMEGYDKYGDSFAAVDIVTNFKRKPYFYVLVLLVPIMLSSFLNCLVYLLPCESGERITLSITAFLTFTVFISYISDKVPSNAENIPLIAYILITQSIMAAMSLFVNILLVRMYYVADSCVWNLCRVLSVENLISDSDELANSRTNRGLRKDPVARVNLKRKIDNVFFILTFVLSISISLMFLILFAS